MTTMMPGARASPEFGIFVPASFSKLFNGAIQYQEHTLGKPVVLPLLRHSGHILRHWEETWRSWGWSRFASTSHASKCVCVCVCVFLEMWWERGGGRSLTKYA